MARLAAADSVRLRHRRGRDAESLMAKLTSFDFCASQAPPGHRRSGSTRPTSGSRLLSPVWPQTAGTVSHHITAHATHEAQGACMTACLLLASHALHIQAKHIPHHGMHWW